MKATPIQHMADLTSDGKAAVWTIANIQITMKLSDHSYTYELIEYDDDTDEWIGEPVSASEARRLCEETIPAVLYL